MKSFKIFVLFFSISVLIITLSGCPDEQSDELVTGVTLDMESATIAVGGRVQLTAAIEPWFSTASQVTWDTSDETVASVGAGGLVTGLANGSAVITVTTVKGNYTASCDVTVDGTPPGEVEDLWGGAERTTIFLCWCEPEDEDFASVRITWTPGHSDCVDVSGETTYMEITELNSSTEYTFTVKTVDSLGNTSAGETVSVMTLPSEGLVGEWLFDGNADDTSGEGNDGTLNDNAPTTGRFSLGDSAYIFTVEDDYISVDDDNSLDFGTGNFSISLWIEYNSDDWGYKTILDKSVNSGESVGITVMVDYPTEGQATMRVKQSEFESEYVESATSNCGNNTWRHFVFIRNGNALKFYIDGSFDQEASFTPTDLSNDADLIFGAAGGTSVNGKLDDIRIYDVALSEDDILALYHEDGWPE